MGAGDTGAIRKNVRVDGPSSPGDRGALGWNLGHGIRGLKSVLTRLDQWPVLSREAQGSRVPDGGVYNRYGLNRRRENHLTALLWRLN